MGPRALARGNFYAVDLSGPVYIASMGPRALARGNQKKSGGRRRDSHASMGPRALARGNGTTPADMSEAEMLQWGRGLSPAEIGILDTSPAKAIGASMGPRALARGNRKWNPLPDSLHQLQWGRGLSPAEMICGPGRAGRITCFNGAAGSRPRK